MPVHFLEGVSQLEVCGKRVPLCVTCLEDAADLASLAELVLAREPDLKRCYREALVGGAGAVSDSLTGRYYAYNLLEWDAACVKRLRRFFHESYLELLSALPHLGRRTAYIQCWANTVRRQEYIEPHNHGGTASYFSGNLAVRVTEPACSFTHYEFQGTAPAIRSRYSIVNQPGVLTIFPSMLFHCTDPWPHDEPRITIAFDIVDEAVAARQARYRTGRRYLRFDPL